MGEEQYVITKKMGSSIMDMMEQIGVECVWDMQNNLIYSKSFVEIASDIIGNKIKIVFELFECGYTTKIISAHFRLDADKEYEILKYVNLVNTVGIPGNVMKLFKQDLLFTERYTDCINRGGNRPITEKMNLNLNLVLKGYMEYIDYALAINAGKISLLNATRALSEDLA